MIYPSILANDAEAEFLQIQNWYEERKENLGQEFAKEVTQTIEKYIIPTPKIFRTINANIRQVSLKRFPHAIFYSLNEHEERIHILAIIHHKQQIRRDELTTDNN